MSKSTYMNLVAFFLLLLIFFACEHEQPIATGGNPATLTLVQQTIFTPKCAIPGCHIPGGAGPMPLTSIPVSFASLVGQPSEQQPNLNRIEPFEPENSYLLRKVRGDASISLDRMPQGGPFLNDSEIDLIRDWIAAGAQNN